MQLATNLPKPTLLSFQYLGFVTSSSSNSDDEPEVILSRIDVLQLTKFTKRMLWGKFGLSINFPGKVTDEKVYLPLQKFTNKIVSDMLLREIYQEPNIGMPPFNENWIDESIKPFLKNDKKPHIEDINVIFLFAIDLAADGTQIPLSMLTHGIDMRLKAKNKKKQGHFQCHIWNNVATNSRRICRPSKGKSNAHPMCWRLSSMSFVL